MLGSGRFLWKRVDSLPKVFNARPSLRQCNSSTSSTHSEEKIVIPKRIERGPTDILEALSSTVNIDPTGFHYSFHDDPYFYPYSAVDKKLYALAKESGKKSAEWIIRKNPKFFSDKLAEPPIKVFEALSIGVKEEDLTEQGLLNAIQERNVVSAIEIYKNLKSQQIDVPKSTKQSLLELVCFFNSEEKPNLDFEEKWLEGFLGKANESIKQKSWKADFAESLYNEMDPNCPLALSAMIQGMLKYQEISNAMKLYEEAEAKHMKLPVSVYNAILEQGMSIIKQKSDTCIFIKKLIREMMNNNVKPNLGTLNGALKMLSRTPYSDYTVELIKEFMNFGIQPSLGSYGYLFQVIARLDPSFTEYNSYHELAHGVFEKIENEEHEILHPCDFSFFINAMGAFYFSRSLREVDLPLRLHDMYLKPTNRKFIVKGTNDHGFYKTLIRIIFKTHPIDFAMDFYRRYVFTVFNPEAKVISEILSAIWENLSSEYLPELLSDMKQLRYLENRPILGRVLRMIDDFTNENSLKVFHEAATSYLGVVEKSWMEGDEDFIPHVLLAFLKNGDEKKLEEALTLIKKKGATFKNMRESVIKSVFEFGIERKNSSIILGSLNLADGEEMESLGEMAERALPFLSGLDKVWAGALLTEKKKRKKSRKPVDVEPVIPSEPESEPKIPKESESE